VGRFQLVEVRSLIDVTNAAAGPRHICAIARKQGETSAVPRRVFCWGMNSAGEVKQPPGANERPCPSR
jgi:hypothetical protein